MKKYFLFIIICISSFMIYTNNVKAANVDSLTVYQLGWTSPDITNVSGWYQTYNFNGIYWSNMGSGTIIFNLSPHCYNFNCDNGIKPITEIDIMTNNDLSVCDIGTIQSTTYVQNTVLYTAKCHVSSGVTGVRIHYQNSVCPSCTDFYGYQFSDSFTYVQDGEDSSSVVNSISGLNSSFQNSLNSLNTTINSASTQAHNDSQNTQQKIDNIDNTIKNDNVSGAETSADELKNNTAFQDNTGLSGIISMPLTFVNSLTNTCQPINLNIPYMDVDVTIPCMQSIITNKMPLLANLIKIVVNGFIVYRILLDIFQIVRNAKNPEDDRIEVLDL